MKVYSAALETGDYVFDDMPDDYIRFGFVSFFHLKNDEQFEFIMSKCKNILIDSGGFSFQRGGKGDIDSYLAKYKRFVEKYTDHPKVQGFFELDVDAVTGYDKVLKMRRELETVSDKIIPVWHPNRGIQDYYDMCDEYKGRRVSVTGFGGDEIADDQYNGFINVAHKHGCNIHILGMTRYRLLNSLNLHKNDSVDSTSWKQTGIFGGILLPDKNNTLQKLKALEGLDVSYKPLITFNLLMSIEIQELLKDRDESIYFER